MLEGTALAMYIQRGMLGSHWSRVEGPEFWKGLHDSRVEVVEFDVSGHGLIGTREGHVHVTANGGEEWDTWRRERVGFSEGEWANDAVIMGDGRHLVLGDEGTLKILAGSESTLPPYLDGTEKVTMVEFDMDGRTGLLGQIDGSVSVTKDGGEEWDTWRREQLGFRETEWADDAVIMGDGRHLVLGDEGTLKVFDGRAWTSPRGLATARAIMIEFDTDGRTGLLGQIDGSVSVTKDGGEEWDTWRREQVGFRETERADDAVIMGDGRHLVLGDEGTLTVFDGHAWTSSRHLPARVGVVAFGTEGRFGLVVTQDGDVFATADGGKRWTEDQISLAQYENASWISAFVGDGRRVLLQTRPVVHTRRGGEWVLSDTLSREAPLEIQQTRSFRDHSVLSTHDGVLWIEAGASGDWSRIGPTLKANESVAALTTDEKGKIIVVGSKGSLLIEGRLEPLNGDLTVDENEKIVAAGTALGSVFVLVEGEGDILDDEAQGGHGLAEIYVRGEFPRLASDPLALHGALENGSQLKRELASNIPQLTGTLESTPQSQATLIDELGVDQVHWLRAVSTLATIYLVQLFVSLYRYSMRLAAFWDSRADAVLLGATFSGANPSFDGLIAALGPDALDFRPPRYSYFPSWRRSGKLDESL